MKLERLQTLPSDWEGTSNHVLQLPPLKDEETEGWSGDVVSPRCPAWYQSSFANQGPHPLLHVEW